MLSGAGQPHLKRVELACVANGFFIGFLLYLGSLRHHQRPQLRVRCQHPMKPDTGAAAAMEPGGNPFPPTVAVIAMVGIGMPTIGKT